MDHVHENYTKTVYGFWVYLMTDCILFGILFATYGVLHNQTFGGPSGKELFNMPFVLGETIALLTSSFTCALAGLASHQEKKNKTLFWFLITFFLGLTFVTMELIEFTHLVKEGNSWERSAFLSSFFTLVATHGTHISFGLIWMTVMMCQIAYFGFKPVIHKRLMCLRMFWHFLDVVWIFIYTVVYLMGVI
ncbi:MAG: cytochrome o ubiquinol oxidase subunit III [Chlamydiae bacterium]|jgi:cytochrome o ubiquinol oxidase subunit 3|nr:cytochrome o ubiquinol oxidase subunit III [Chlamydiota bacterium]